MVGMRKMRIDGLWILDDYLKLRNGLQVVWDITVNYLVLLRIYIVEPSPLLEPWKSKSNVVLEDRMISSSLDVMEKTS